MIQFFINNTEIVLPEDFSFQLTDENPLITRNGEFSLDITSSLLEPANAKAFGHINRLNKSTILLEGNAVMIDDGKVKNGKYKVVKWTNIDVTWQYITGNSELNFIAGNDRKIWDLAWGTANEVTTELAIRSIQYPGYGYHRQSMPPASWNQNYVCTPVKIKTTIVNDFSFTEGYIDVNPIVLPLIDNVANILIQPYLLYYVNKLPELLGYTLQDNCLNTDYRALRMYLVNNIQSLNYSDFLPDWTILKFITEVENLFNVRFSINNKDKTLSVISNVIDISLKKIVNPVILDDFTRDESTTQNAEKLNPTKIKYNLGTDGILKYQNISEDIIDLCEINEFTTDAELWDIVDTLPAKDEFKLLRNTVSEYDYFYSLEPKIILDYKGYTNSKYVYLINKFNPYKNISETDEANIELAIAPSEIDYATKNVTFHNNAIIDTYSYEYYLSKSNQSEIISSTENDMLNVIEGGSTYSRKTTLEVSLYSGLLTFSERNLYTADLFYFETVILHFPFSHIDINPEFGYTGGDTSCYYKWLTWKSYFADSTIKSLRLNGPAGIKIDYYDYKIIENFKVYQFLIIDSPDIDIDYIFEYNNQRYIPIKFERTKSKVKGLVTGYFYRLI